MKTKLLHRLETYFILLLMQIQPWETGIILDLFMKLSEL
jgi:hypothetical protein